ALAHAVAIRVVRLAEASRRLTRHQHLSALLALGRRGGLLEDGRRLPRLGDLGAGPPRLGSARGGAGGPGAHPTPGPPLRAGLTAWPAGRRLRGGRARRRVALVDPHLDPDAAERGSRLEKAVVDVRPQRVQRHPTLAVELRPAHL